MADGEPVTPGELAGRTQTRERYVREWLAAGGERLRRPTTRPPTPSSCTPEQALAFADEPDSPAFVPGAFQLARRDA